MIRIIIISSLLAWPSFLTAFQGRIHSASGKSISVLGKGLHKLKVGDKLYFYAGVNQTGWGVVTQTFHTKAIAELKRGAAQKDFIVRDYSPVKPLASQKQIVAQIVKGGSHTCGLHEGQVFCWGWNEYGQTRVPPLKNPVQILSGGTFSCAIDDTGIVCWGNNKYGEAAAPKLKSPSQIAAGGSHTCALHAKGVSCWGDNQAYESTVPPLKNPTQIASGGSGSCAIDETGVLCWGNNSDGQVTVPNELRFGKGKE